MFGQEFSTWSLIIIIALVLWTIPWKGFALWHAARLGHKWWFILFLLVNTVAILEIVYLWFIVRPSHQKEGRE